ncbi:MAG TPA: hypothetical protein VKX28_12100 [Xanthobacteraceae bacterium]|nr:hypothetical protein [Xanthobacteraceae bacterium]
MHRTFSVMPGNEGIRAFFVMGEDVDGGETKASEATPSPDDYGQ